MKALRIATVVLGLALAIYGVASLTGGWLGTPLWWDQGIDMWDGVRVPPNWDRSTPPDWSSWEHIGGVRKWREPARGWIGVTIIAAGLALATLAAWPRRPRLAPPA